MNPNIRSILRIFLFITYILIIPAIILAEPNITGDTPTDFYTDDTQVVPDPDDFLNVPPPAGSPGDPVDFDNTGWELLGIYFDYDANTDTLFVGFDCEAICGDADGNGDPSTLDPAYSTQISEYANLDSTESISLIIDTDNDGNFDYAVGVTGETAGDPPNDISAFGIYDFGGAGDPSTPYVGYGVAANTQPGVSTTATLLNNPTAAQPDFQFRIDDFSTLNGFSFTPGEAFAFNIIGYAGSQEDITGEDYVRGGTVTEGVTVNMSATAALGDYTWIDANADGLQDATDIPLDNVTVNLYNFGPDGTPNNGDDVVVRTTQTGSGSFVPGEYFFDLLDVGNYYLEFSLPTGFRRTDQNVGGDDSIDSDADVTTGITATTELVANEVDRTWDAGYFQPAAIGDFVWEDLNANGVQDGGEPGIDGVQVELLDSSGNPVTTDIDGNPLSNPDTTAGGGIYGFTNLRPGDYQLRFTPLPSYDISPQDAGGNDIVDSDINDAGLTVVTTLASGETDLTWDAGFYLPSALGDYVWLDENRNGLQDEGGTTGVSGVTVNLIRESTATVIRTTTTDSNGNYLFDDLGADTYTVEFILDVSQLTLQDAGADDIDSDADLVTGRDTGIVLPYNTTDLTHDAGLVELPPAPTSEPGVPEPIVSNPQPTLSPALSEVTALPATGETMPLRDALPMMALALLGMVGLGAWMIKR